MNERDVQTSFPGMARIGRKGEDVDTWTNECDAVGAQEKYTTVEPSLAWLVVPVGGWQLKDERRTEPEDADR